MIFIAIPGFCSIFGSDSTEAEPMATHHQARPVVSTTSISQVDGLSGVVAFLVPEYNLEEICRTILMTTGVRVALRYQRIHNNLPEQVHSPPTVHEIHIEVDKTTPQIQRESIGLVFSPKTN